ncbi:MAG: tRNA-binding protein [Acidimicrobiia bacterium]
MTTASVDDFDALNLRIATIVRCELHTEARDAAYKLWLDLGSEGEVQSSAKLTELYSADSLVGRQVVVVAGLGAMRVAGFRSDLLVLGVETPEGVVLLSVDGEVAPGVAVT